MENETADTFDLLHIFRKLPAKAPLILLAGAAAALIAFCLSAFLIPPQYQSSVTMYVNNSSTIGGGTISSADISAAQYLVNTYSVILRTRTTMDRVIERTSSARSADDLIKMAEAEAVDSTQFLKITVTCDDPFEAAELADAMGAVLTERVNEIIDGSSARLMDRAIADADRVFPKIGKSTVIGFVIGALLLCAVITAYDLLDTVVHTEDDLLARYDIPLLASVPDLTASGTGRYGSRYGCGNDGPSSSARSEDRTGEKTT